MTQTSDLEETVLYILIPVLAYAAMQLGISGRRAGAILVFGAAVFMTGDLILHYNEFISGTLASINQIDGIFKNELFLDVTSVVGNIIAFIAVLAMLMAPVVGVMLWGRQRMRTGSMSAAVRRGSARYPR